MGKFTARDIYYSEIIWTEPLRIRALRDVISWNDSEPLSVGECLDLYNRWLIPIWNNLSGTKKAAAREQEKSADCMLVRTKGEFLELFWIIHECLSMPELNFGMVLNSPNGHE